MENQKINVLGHLYGNYAQAKVEFRLGISDDSEFSQGLVCGCVIAYETALSMVLSPEEFNACLTQIKEKIANRLNVSIKDVEKVL